MELRSLAPIDQHYQQFIRYGKYKAVIRVDGELELYDMLHPKSGIGEQAEVTAEQAEVVKFIKQHLEDNRITQRHYTIPRQ